MLVILVSLHPIIVKADHKLISTNNTNKELNYPLLSPAMFDCRQCQRKTFASALALQQHVEDKHSVEKAKEAAAKQAAAKKAAAKIANAAGNQKKKAISPPVAKRAASAKAQPKAARQPLTEIRAERRGDSKITYASQLEGLDLNADEDQDEVYESNEDHDMDGDIDGKAELEELFYQTEIQDEDDEDAAVTAASTALVGMRHISYEEFLVSCASSHLSTPAFLELFYMQAIRTKTVMPSMECWAASSASTKTTTHMPT